MLDNQKLYILDYNGVLKYVSKHESANHQIDYMVKLLFTL